MGSRTNEREAIHLGSMPDPAVLDSLADFICGDDGERYPEYRSSSYLTRFFQSVDINVVHDGSTRKWWVLDVLNSLQPHEVERIILRLVDLRTYKGQKDRLLNAKTAMDEILSMDGFRIGYQGHKPVILQTGHDDLEDYFGSADKATTTDEFLKQHFSEDIRINELGLDTALTRNLQDRIDEVRAAPRDNMPLGCIFLLGSTLEGLLLAIALNESRTFVDSKAAPKDKFGKTKSIPNWSLSELINVSHDLDVLSLDVKRFSHELRDFRNFIHPHQQVSLGFSPDQNTVDICWHVFKAAFSQLRRHIKGKNNA